MLPSFVYRITHVVWFNRPPLVVGHAKATSNICMSLQTSNSFSDLQESHLEPTTIGECCTIEEDYIENNGSDHATTSICDDECSSCNESLIETNCDLPRQQ